MIRWRLGVHRKMAMPLTVTPLCLYLLLLGLPAASQGQDATETVFWQSVECESRSQVDVYLEVYPTGAYVAAARACLEEQLGLDRAARRVVQQGLAALDYTGGAPDGLFGPATRTALRQWQAGKGFAATGYLTREQADTLLAQGREVGAAQRPAASGPPGPPCAGQAEGAACWLELTGQPGCYVFTTFLLADARETWTGACVEGLAHGTGTLTRIATDGTNTRATGRIRHGKRHGQWVRRNANGSVEEGPFVDGNRHGQWVLRGANGDVWEGPYVDGKMHGQWVLRGADGGVREGPYVDGNRHGQWVLRGADGGVREGPYVDGNRHGQWVLRLANGDVWEGPYVDGKIHGQWVIRGADGGVREGPYVDGKMHGQWVLRGANGDVWEGPYVDGKMHGQWVIRGADGDVWEGPFVDGELQF